MQTRRDQLQAYRFQNRRALAALVTGQPNVLEPPMRRLTVTTLSGIMIAILIAMVFGIIAIIHPSAGDSWKKNGAVIVDTDNNSTYVYIDKTLHPVLNYTSAVLAVSGSNSVSHIQVSSSDIAGATYGREIGIANVPSALPPESSLVGYPISVCSTQRANGAGTVKAHVDLYAHERRGSDSVDQSKAVLVASASSPAMLSLLVGGRRLPLPSANIETALDLGVAPLVVGTAFLDSIPQGPILRRPTVTDAGTTASYLVAGHHVPIGTLFRTSGSSAAQYYVALDDGVAPLTAFEAVLYTGVTSVPITAADASDALEHNQAPGVNELSTMFRGLPPMPPVSDAAASQGRGLCAVFGSAAGAPRITAESSAPPVSSVAVGQSGRSRIGLADTVHVPATKGVLVAAPASSSVAIVSDQGIRYSFANNGLLSAFGYASSDIVHVPSALLNMIDSGPGLDAGAARRSVSP